MTDPVHVDCSCKFCNALRRGHISPAMGVPVVDGGEREAIVEWIRGQAQGRLDCATYMRIAEDIEYGEHLKTTTGGT